MVDYTTQAPMTAHTSNLVWFSLISNRAGATKDKIRIVPTGGNLSGIAPTMLEVMKMDKPKEMDGLSLIEKN